MNTSLTISDEASARLRLDRLEAEARARATALVCDVLAMGLVEGAEYMARRILMPAIGYEGVRRARSKLFPGYVFLRDTLIGELDADPVLAARIAAKHTATHNRLVGWLDERGPFYAGREVGWL